MTFSEFIKHTKINRNIETTKDFYKSLGGIEKLGISLTYFQQIENGTRPPSAILFSSLFNLVSNKEKRDLVISYLKSSVEKNDNIINFLEKYLQFPESDSQSSWDQSVSLSYSDEQLNVLTSNLDILSTYIKILLLDGCELKFFKKKSEALKKLKVLDLIKIKSGYVYPIGKAYLLPTLDNNAKARSRRLGSEYVLQILDLFLEREGSKNQELRYGIQYVDKETATQILEEVKALRNRFFSMATIEPSLEKKIPAVFIGFAKIFNIEELD